MKNLFSKKSASSGNDEQAPPDVKKGKAKEKKKKKKSSDGEKTQKVNKKKEQKKKSDETIPKKERAPPPRIAAAEEAVPSDDDPTTPGVGGNLTPDQLSVFRRLYKVRTPGQIEKVKEAFTEEEIARVKEKFEDPSVSKMLKKKEDSANPMTGFAKYSGGPQAFKGLDPSKWRLQKFRFSGKAKCEVTGDLQEVHAPIREGLVHFLTSPIKYIAMMFQKNMTDFDPEKQKFTLLHRLGTYQYRPQNTTDLGDRNAEGIFTLLGKSR